MHQQLGSRCTDSASAARQSLATKRRQPPQWEWSWLLPSLDLRALHQQLGSRSALRQAVARQCDSERAAALLGNATASQRASQSFGNATASQRASRCTDSASAARQSPLATKQRQPPQWEWSWLLPSLGDSERAAALTSCDSEPLHWLYISSS